MRVIRSCQSADGSVKRVHELDDGCLIESVFIPHKTKINLCISSQVGCRMRCGFCATGKVGFVRDLTAAEILGQVDVPADSVVFMGMGEPLDNPHILDAIELLKNEKGIPSRKITVSTCGIIDKTDLLLPTKVDIAISLNATTQLTRSILMPISRKFTLAALAEKMRWLDAKLPRNRRLQVEYVMIAGVNDSLDDARRFEELVPKRSLVNLIPLNDGSSKYRAPAAGTVAAFKAELRRFGYVCYVREPRGKDVFGACGMLSPK